VHNSIDFKDIWQELLEFLKQDPEVGPVKVNLWFAPIKPVSLEKGVFKLKLPNSMFRQTIQARFENKIISFIKNLLFLQEDLKPEYIIEENEKSVSSGAEQESFNQEQRSARAVSADFQKSAPASQNASPVQNNVLQQKAKTSQNSFMQTNAENKADASFNAQPAAEAYTDSKNLEKQSAESIETASWQPEAYRKKAAEILAEKNASNQNFSNPAALHPLFDPDYTFESFIVGTSNRFAYAAAQALVNNKQSPFFIYSTPGLGKTHLLHAIAHGLYRLNPKVKVLLSSAETFVNEYIRDVGNKKAEAFREKYRMLDCLLLDDVQFLLEKEKSVEEFFYTFNALFDSKKRIVITSDRPPQELALGDRLISRFMSGTVADIRLPDYETRVAILRQKNDQWHFDIPLDIVNFIAEKVHKGGRELEGCLRTVNNFCQQTGARATIDSVKELLRPMFSSPADDQPINIKTIMKVVADQYKIDVKDLTSSRRDSEFVTPRHLAMYLSVKHTDLTKEKIGEAFNRNHSTVIAAEKKIEEEIKNPFFNEVINKIIRKIKDVNNDEDNRL